MRTVTIRADMLDYYMKHKKYHLIYKKKNNNTQRFAHGRCVCVS